jgi:hypothetical protein
MTAPFIPIIKEKADILLTSKQKYTDFISKSIANINNTGKFETMNDCNWTDNF